MICSACKECLVRACCTNICLPAMMKLIDGNPEEIMDVLPVSNLNITHTSEGYFEIDIELHADLEFVNHLLKNNHHQEIHVSSAICGRFPNQMTLTIKKRIPYCREDK